MYVLPPSFYVNKPRKKSGKGLYFGAKEPEDRKYCMSQNTAMDWDKKNTATPHTENGFTQR